MPTDRKEKISFDTHAGKKLRNRRIQLKKTQTNVAHATNKTFQQVQKYEKGVNGMSGFVLGEVARYLKVPVTYFYEGYDYNHAYGYGLVDATAAVNLAENWEKELPRTENKLKPYF